MENQTLEGYLRAHPFLEGLAEEYIALLAGCARNARFDAGTPIVRLGAEASEFILIRHGSVAIETPLKQGGSVVIQNLSEGDVLGWSWLFPPYQWRFDAHATSVTRTLALDATCLRRKCESDARFGYDLLKRFAAVMTQRLEAARRQLIELHDHQERAG